MKNYVNTILLVLLVLLSTIYFINCRMAIVDDIDDLTELYGSIDENVEEISSHLQTMYLDDNGSTLQSDINSVVQEAVTPTPTENTSEQEVSGTGIGVTGGYYVMLKDNMIVVTESDRNTILEHTGVSAEGLDVSEVEGLTEGIYIEDMDQVFNILESLTS